MKTLVLVAAWYAVCFVSCVGVLIAVDASITAIERHHNKKKKPAEVVA